MTADADARSVERAVRSLYTAVEHGDLDLMGALWLDGTAGDETVCIHPGWPAVRGRSSVLRSWAVVMAGTPYVQFFLTDLEVTVNGDTAVVTCAESMLTGDDEGDGFVGAQAVSTKVLRRTPGGWRIQVHHSSPILASSDDDEEDEGLDDEAGDEDDPTAGGAGGDGRGRPDVG
ncbi:nuclear transport factor 2 family protein [Motilibacter deserti]|uniref:Nuclear transport factor 2 family protein n=1 Tax=Motilibacter deserti TaxID=2714956 RepID=A0ABX0H0Q5_9ACTN|nr:nuclear transport factor 2 family protein [Motilibacter deserti]